MGCANGSVAGVAIETEKDRKPPPPAIGTLLEQVQTKRAFEAAETQRAMLQQLERMDRAKVLQYPGKLPKLLQACKDGDVDAVHMCLRNIHERQFSEGDLTALQLAAVHGRTYIARTLISAGAEVNTTDSVGSTPLHEAAAHGHRDIVQMLLANGAKVDATDAQAMTPLHWAASMGHESVVMALLDAGADKNALTTRGVTPHALARSSARITMDCLR